MEKNAVPNPETRGHSEQEKGTSFAIQTDAWLYLLTVLTWHHLVVPITKLPAKIFSDVVYIYTVQMCTVLPKSFRKTITNLGTTYTLYSPFYVHIFPQY